MKRFIVLFSSFLSLASVFAQDMILLRDGQELDGKVEMITNGIISYKGNAGNAQVETSKVYLIKYEQRGNAFYNSEGEVQYNSDNTYTKLGKKDIAIYLCEGSEIIASEVNLSNENVNYKAGSQKGALSGLFGKKTSKDWISIPKEKVFLIRYYDGSREVINDLSKIEEQARLDALPKVKHPFIPINKDPNYPCPAVLNLVDNTQLQVIIYDLDREYIHYRKKDWQDGPIFRI